MSDPDVPDQVVGMMNVMLACLSDAVSTRINPPANVCFRVGDLVAWDADVYTNLCCEGLAYVSLGEIYPADDLLARALSATRQTARSCPFPAWAMVMKVGIVRCAPTGTSTTMPTCEDWNSAAAQNFADAAALREASCCFRSYWTNTGDPGMDVLINTQVQVTPQGGCMERFVTVTAQFANCEAC